MALFKDLLTTHEVIFKSANHISLADFYVLGERYQSESDKQLTADFIFKIAKFFLVTIIVNDFDNQYDIKRNVSYIKWSSKEMLIGNQQERSVGGAEEGVQVMISAIKRLQKLISEGAFYGKVVLVCKYNQKINEFNLEGFYSELKSHKAVVFVPRGVSKMLAKL